MLAFAAVSSLSLLTHQATRHGRPGFHPCNSGTPLTAITQRDPGSGQPAPGRIQIVAFCETATVLQMVIVAGTRYVGGPGLPLALVFHEAWLLSGAPKRKNAPELG
jgi:hypothetical protein